MFSGTGGGDALGQHCTDDNAYYGYIRVPTVVDGTNTVKFVFVIFLGDKLKVVKKAKIATHKGAVQDFVGQYHICVEASSAEECSSEAISKAVEAATFESTGKNN